MTSELHELGRLTEEIGTAADGIAPQVAAGAERLGERLRTGRFHVSVLGDFKRGKSTLVNALVGQDVVPVGAIPVTAVATELAYGEPSATLISCGGGRRTVALSRIAEHVTEAGNPDNEQRIARVEAALPAPLLEPGLVLTDTPGLGSVHAHNTAAAEAALAQTDGAIVVLGADAPLSAQEREVLRDLAARQARVFVVVNKADHLHAEDHDDVRQFVATGVERALGHPVPIWLVSARAASAGEDDDALEFSGFRAALEDFVHNDLVGERITSARHELVRLATALAEALRLRAAALDLDIETLTARIGGFEQAAVAARTGLEEDETVFVAACEQLAAGIGERLTTFARQAATRRCTDITRAADAFSRNELEDGLRTLVERVVSEEFEALRQHEATRSQSEWASLADRFRLRTQARVNTVRNAAVDLFSIPLPDVVVPRVDEEHERFFYLFLEVGSTSEELDRAARRLLPERIVRRRLVARAQARVAQEFDKHAGRARWDLTQRLDAVQRRFWAAMRVELDQSIDAIARAVRVAEDHRAMTVKQRDATLAEDRRRLEVAERVGRVAQPGTDRLR